MIKVVQFEVYVREKGRWGFHARYPGYEWDQALEDARRTEVRTGLPTKVIKDTYDPEVGQSKESVAYLSPNAKSNNTEQSATSAAHGPNTRGGNGQSQSSLPPVSDATFFFRLILSLGASVIIAGALTILLNTVLNALPKLGYQITSAFGSQMLMYWYVVMLMLSAIALNRAYVPWRRMLAGRQTREFVSDSESSRTRKSKPAPGFTGLKPKNQSSEQKAEREKDIQDMKVLRGDLDASQMMPDTLDAPATLGSATEPNPVSYTAPTPQALPTSTPAPDPVQAVAPSPAEAAEVANASEPDREIESFEATSPPSSLEEVPNAPPPLTDMDMDGLTMVRFLGDVVMSVRSGQDQLDGTTRFGMSLYLAGAAATLADQRGLTPRREKEILADALERIGHSKAISDSFLARYDEHLNARRNQSLIEAGENDMLEHLRSPDGPAQELGGLIEQWEQPEPPPQTPIGGAFLLTYTDIPQSAQPEAAAITMNRHNHEVRHALEDARGTEVRHTGKGIFAHFDHPDDALTAAIAIQRSYQASRTSPEPLPPSRIALIASMAQGSDSDISGDVFRSADVLCRRLQSGQIASDIRLREACTSSAVNFGREIPRTHSGIAGETKAQEVLWQAMAETP